MKHSVNFSAIWSGKGNEKTGPRCLWIKNISEHWVETAKESCHQCRMATTAWQIITCYQMEIFYKLKQHQANN